jgi:hypothetical protein
MNRLLLATLTLSASGFAQTFDVATVKKADPPAPGKPVFMGRRGGPGTDDPGRITWSNVNLRTLLTTAYDVKPYQVTVTISSRKYPLARPKNKSTSCGRTCSPTASAWRSTIRRKSCRLMKWRR